jgi:hypothetical protein
MLTITPKPGWTTKGYRCRDVPVSLRTAEAAKRFIELRPCTVVQRGLAQIGEHDRGLAGHGPVHAAPDLLPGGAMTKEVLPLACSMTKRCAPATAGWAVSSAVLRRSPCQSSHK